MKKHFSVLFVFMFLVGFSSASFAYEFGVVDAAKIFSEYKETQRTRNLLESEKLKLQSELESRKQAVEKLDNEYLEVAQRMQQLRDERKESEARALEPRLSELRQQLSQQTAQLQEYFEHSQRQLYELEERHMGELSQSLDDKVESVIETIAKKHKIKAVFEKRFFYYGDDKTVKDLTDEVIAALNR